MIGRELTSGTIADILANGPHDDLLRLPVALSMDPPEGVDVEAICLQLAKHPHENVRGNAMLAFGHLARTLRRLDEARVKPVLEEALHDASPCVCAHAEDAISDIRHFLGWKFRGSRHRAAPLVP